MRLTFVTPLFPPDVHAVALYHKALAGELAKTNITTVLVYGKYPESVNRVTFVAIDKQEHKRVRVFKMILALLTARSTTDVYLITNGPSTELPALVLSYLTKKPIIFVASDSVTYSPFGQFIHTRLQKRVARILTITAELPNLVKPEIHPLLPYPTEAIRQYETTWAAHITNLVHTIHHVTTS